MPRVKLNQNLVDELMWRSDRTCNLCQKERSHIEIHHLDGDSTNDEYDNLIVLCRNCHSEASSRGLGRRISTTLLLRYKRLWEGVVNKRREELAATRALPTGEMSRPELETVARSFEDYMMKRDALGVLSFFTPPRTKTERRWLEEYVLGGDLGPPGQFIRLFATRGFGYRVTKFEIRSVKLVAAKKAEVAIEEWRTWWGNEGGWELVPYRMTTRLTLVEVGAQWFVDRYTQPADKHYRHKYGGLGG